MPLQNAHVLVWMSFKHFLATHNHRFMAQLYWATEHEQELKRMATASAQMQEQV